jgi:DNA topoisomerase-1
VRLLDATPRPALAEALAGSHASAWRGDGEAVHQPALPPFITSTLQQEAGRKLRFTAQRTMRVAQSLYENGYITYMRTDSTTLSSAGAQAARVRSSELYGASTCRTAAGLRPKAKNAQEAHEAIRPAGESSARRRACGASSTPTSRSSTT